MAPKQLIDGQLPIPQASKLTSRFIKKEVQSIFQMHLFLEN